MNHSMWSFWICKVNRICFPVLFGMLLVFGNLELSSAIADDDANKKVVMCSTTQIADFARQVVGDRWKVICVLGPAEDPHTYETSNEDLLTVKGVDLCLENGWNLEGHGWMRDLAKGAGKPIATCVDGVRPLMISEEGETIEDPHAWFNPKHAMIYVTNIKNAISKVDPEHAAEYEARAKLYMIQLRAVDYWVAEQVNAIPKARRVLVTHHDAFGYFCEAYGFEAKSPVGWTTGELTDVSIDQKQKVIDEIRNIGVKSIFVETSVNKELIQDIAKQAGVQIGGELYSDAMGEAGSAGETYIGMLRENVLTIVEHLK